MVEIAKKLRERKHELGISEEKLAAVTGLSRTAVRQVLSDPSRASTANVSAVAGRLGLRIEAVESFSSYEVRRKAALEKAKRLVALVQGNSLLELQGVDDGQLRDMIEQTADEIMAGSPRNVWN
ncbi:MAG: helix-turn-helix domain-containing protein [Pirellulaceae bacterium]|nr:helix-turn-helix domain-containing protein [Planctomycetales bacterium]